MIDSRLLDLSHYDQEAFDERCLFASGIRRVILGTTRRDVTEGQIIACRSVGIEVVGLYGLPYYGGRQYVTRDVDNAIRLRELYGIPYFAIDAEIDACDVPSFSAFNFPRPTVEQRQAETALVRRNAEGAGFRCLMYTGGYWWTANMGNSTAHADLPLWYANYGTNNPAAPIRAIEQVNFGGWSTVTIHQYSSTIPVCGRGRDHNYLLKPLGEDAMTPAERAEFDALQNLVIWLVKQTYGSTDRMKELEEIGRIALEARVSRFEDNNGPIGTRLNALEHHHHDGGGVTRDAILAALQAAEDSLLGEGK